MSRALVRRIVLSSCIVSLSSAVFEPSAEAGTGGKLVGLGIFCGGVVGMAASIYAPIPPAISGIQASEAEIRLGGFGAFALLSVGGLSLVMASSGGSKSSQLTQNSRKRSGKPRALNNSLLPYYKSGKLPPYKRYDPRRTTKEDLLYGDGYYWYHLNMNYWAFSGMCQHIAEEQSAAHPLPQYRPEDVERFHDEHLRENGIDPDTGRFVDRDHDGIPDSIDRHIDTSHQHDWNLGGGTHHHDGGNHHQTDPGHHDTGQPDGGGGFDGGGSDGGDGGGGGGD